MNLLGIQKSIFAGKIIFFYLKITKNQKLVIFDVNPIFFGKVKIRTFFKVSTELNFNYDNQHNYRVRQSRDINNVWNFCFECEIEIHLCKNTSEQVSKF